MKVQENNKMFDLEVIIPCFNEEEFLEIALASVIKAKNKSSLKILITISDNCSEDRSLLIAQKYINSNKNIKLITNEKNIGSRENWISALKNVNAKYFMFLDAHDIIDDGYFFEFEKSITKYDSQNMIFMPNEFMVFDEIAGEPVRYEFQYKFHKNPKIRFWQLVFYLHHSTEIHSIFPTQINDFGFIQESNSTAFDHLFMHFYFTKYGAKYLDSPYYRRYKKNVGSHDAYVNSFGKIENREQRVIGDSNKKATNEFLADEIIKAAGWAIPKRYHSVARILLYGKYHPKSSSFFFYRLCKISFSIFVFYKAVFKK